jgi:hypothetical protein
VDTPRQRYTKRLAALKNERASWIEHWRELGEYISPRRFRYLYADTNKGWKRNHNIINNTATKAARTLSSGMMAGITSPARPWFRLSTPDPSMAEYGPVRAWLEVVEERLRDAFLKSNVYNGLHSVYEYLGTFGTSVMHVEEDSQDLLRAYVFPIGQFCLGNSSRLQVDTVVREFSMTVGQLVEKFGIDNVSDRVRDQHKSNQTETWVQVVHFVEPNPDAKPGQASPKHMPVRSCWYEATGDENAPFLREGGFEEFPMMATRWSVTGEDVYGASPGMEALGDVKAMQLFERRKGQAMDKIINPPMRAPMSLQNMRASLLPGDVTYVAENSAGQTFSPAIEINPAAIQVAEASIREHEQRINSAYFADLWLMMANAEQTDMTAREVAERHEEKMLQLGPVMERLEGELLDPLIDRAFGILLRAGQLPKAPKELQGQSLRVEYLSIMAQAQKMLGTASIERLAGFVGNLAAVRPEVMDKVDVDQMVDEYAANLGVKSNLIVADEQVQAMREQRNQAAQQQAAQQQAMVAAQGAKTLAQADTSGDNALTRLLQGVGGAAGAQAAPNGGGQLQ